MNYSATTATEVATATRTNLIVAARSVFARKGFDGASVREITREASANLGAITYHFGSKRGLYEAVLDAGLRPLAERVRSVVAGEGTAHERMAGVVVAYFDHLALHPDLPHLLMQEIAAGKPPPEVLLEIVGGVIKSIGSLQREGEDDGSIRAGDPMLTALSVIAQPIYLTLVSPLLKTVAQIDLSDPTTRQQTLEHAVAFVRRGLEPRTEAGS
jgi:TetR/AcrR family transcriptional regulator